MKLTLENSISYVEINSNGAYIDTFEVNGKSIFFPKLMVKIKDQLKVRGGMHVCAPNFGEDNIFHNLGNHGFARDLIWEIVDYGNDFAKLSLDGIDIYEDVKFIIYYKLNKTDLFAKLLIENNSNKQVLIAPGFHTYFYADHRDIVINDRKIDKGQLPESIIYESFNENFITDDNKIFIEGLENINEFVFWSDFKGDYICVGPTYKAMAFKEDSREPFKLEAGKRFEQSINIKVVL